MNLSEKIFSQASLSISSFHGRTILAECLISYPRFSRLLFAIFQAFLSKLHFVTMTWQYLFWLLLRRNSNKLTEMYHLLANIFVLKSLKLTLFHHYNLCGKITRRWHFCGFSFFLNSNRQIDWTISCKKYGAWNIFLFTGDLQSLILVYLMKQTSANNGGYLIWVLTLFVGAPALQPLTALLLTSSQVEGGGCSPVESLAVRFTNI